MYDLVSRRYVFFLISAYFVWRSFYSMRIGGGGVAVESGTGAVPVKV